MAKESNSVDCSDPVDPLANYPSFSLFPIFSSSSSLLPLTQTPNFINRMVLQNTDNLMTQAKAILDGSLNAITTDKPMATVCENRSEAICSLNDKIMQERRPALGLKRAKFSAKPLPSSQADLNLEPTLDIGKFEDPEVFFAAFERMENAKKELQKHKGEPLMDLDQNCTNLPPRGRRPSLLGKSATYKHRSYSSIGPLDNDEALLLSQEASGPNLLSSSREETIHENDVMNTSPPAQISDIKSAMDSVGNELDELLSCSYEGLDQDGVQNLLLDKLNIKLIDIGKPSFPDLPDVRRRGYESSSEAVINMKDTMHHANGRSKTPSNLSYQLRKSPTNYLVSPTLSKSPLASISLLNRRISKLPPSTDLYSWIDVDSSPKVVSSPEKQNVQETDQIDQSQQLQESLNSSVNKDEKIGGFSSPLVSAGNSGGLNNESDKQVMGVSRSEIIEISERSHESHRPLAWSEENIAISGKKIPSPTLKDIPTSGKPEEFVDPVGQNAQTDAREDMYESARSPTHGGDNLGDPTSVHTEQEVQVAEVQEPSQKEELTMGFRSEHLSFNGGEDGDLGEPLNPQSSIERPVKKKVGSLKSKRRETEAPMVPSGEFACVENVNRQAKSTAPFAKEPKSKRRKVESALSVPSEVDERLRRLSLYGAGTKWEAGLRRSSRIRMRPLEFWRGERFLYGRVHQSVVSVIGVKYASPTKSGEETGVKVKSFVSDEYKDLIEQASLH